MLGEKDFAVLLFENTRNRGEVFVLRDKNGGSSDGGETENG